MGSVRTGRRPLFLTIFFTVDLTHTNNCFRWKVPVQTTDLSASPFNEILLKYNITPLSDQFSVSEEQKQDYNAVMAEQQRVYLVKKDVENAVRKSLPPSAPLLPKSNLLSENVNAAANPRQVMREQFPPREAPRFYSSPPKRRHSFCCLCLLWIFCLLLLFIVAIIITAAIFYAVFQPRIPKYTVDNIQITSFSLSSDATVSSQFAVGVRATNPNKMIGIYYLDESYIGVSYAGTELCKGKLPVFYQGHRSTVDLNVILTGINVQITSKMVTLLNEQKQQGSIPLRLKADVPVKVKIGKVKTMKITFRVRCELVVDRLDENTSVNISTKKCKVKL